MNAVADLLERAKQVRPGLAGPVLLDRIRQARECLGDSGGVAAVLAEA